MRVAAFQLDVRRGDVAANVERVERGLRAAADRGVELVGLPEMWPTSFVADGDDADWLERTDEALERVRALSRELGIAVCGSGFGPGAPGERLRNRMVLFDNGEEVLSYDKVHLFSPTGEDLAFSAGEEPPATVELRGARVSGAVCYDLRFGALLRAPYVAEAELLLVPAQWPKPREPHWRALVTGRAVEHQAFVLAVNRTGRDLVGRRRLALDFPGNSLVVSPNGETLAEGRGQDGLVEAELDLRLVRELRRRVPVRRDERRELYARWRG